jgi:flagellar biosynthesis/type III secretory pathway protein FliH
VLHTCHPATRGSTNGRIRVQVGLGRKQNHILKITKEKSWLHNHQKKRKKGRKEGGKEGRKQGKEREWKEGRREGRKEERNLCSSFMCYHLNSKQCKI